MKRQCFNVIYLEIISFKTRTKIQVTPISQAISTQFFIEQYVLITSQAEKQHHLPRALKHVKNMLNSLNVAQLARNSLQSFTARSFAKMLFSVNNELKHKSNNSSKQVNYWLQQKKLYQIKQIPFNQKRLFIQMLYSTKYNQCVSVKFQFSDIRYIYIYKAVGALQKPLKHLFDSRKILCYSSYC